VFSEFATSEISALVQVVFIDLVLAGDNAIVVGMAAATVTPDKRRKVICGGILMAVILRILFATVTVQILAVIGLTLAGGLLLLWVCWKFYREITETREEDIGADMLDVEDGEHAEASPAVKSKPVSAAILQVAIADISMSLDNVLAVAGAAQHHMSALIVGLTLSVILMGVAANVIAHLLQRYHWIAYIGLLLVSYVAFSMIWRGAVEVATVAVN